MFSSTVALLFFVILLSITYYLYKKRKKYTRERFAFSLLLTSSSALFLIIQSLLGSNPFSPLIFSVNFILGTNYAVPAPDFSSNALTILVFGIFLHFMNSIHTAWDGVISVSQHEKEKTNNINILPMQFIGEGISEIKRIGMKQPPHQIYEHPTTAKRYSEPLNIEEQYSWKKYAKSLVTSKFSDLFFDDENWHDRISCWIGKDKKTNIPTIIFCPQHNPTSEDIKKTILILQTKSFPNHNAKFELLVVTQEKYSPTYSQIDNAEISYFSKEQLLTDLVDFDDYLFDIKKQVETNKLPDSNLTLKDTYVESWLIDSKKKDTSLSFENYLEQWLTSSSRQQLALLGEYGQGKSTGSLMFTYNVLCQQKIKTDRIPILIDLRGKNPSSLEPEQLLAVWAEKYDISPKALFNLLLAGKLLIIFEGFDEMQGVTDQEARMAHFSSLWKFSYPNSKLLITGRPNFFLDDEELKQSLGINDQNTIGSTCRAVYLKPFDETQVRASLRKTDSSITNEILALFRESEPFKDIASRPSLLYLISILWDTEEFRNYRKNNEITSAAIMSIFIDHCCKRQTEKQSKANSSSKRFMTLNEKERKYFMEGVAAYLWNSNLQNKITSNQLKSLCAILFQNIPDSASKANLMTENNVTPLRTRLAEHPQALDEVYTNVRSYGLLVRDLATRDSFKFSHKSFLEYLYAEYLANYILRDNLETFYSIEKSLTPKLFLGMLQLPTKESIAFAGEIIASRIDHDETISKLFDKLVFRKQYHNKLTRALLTNTIMLPRTKTELASPRGLLAAYTKLLSKDYNMYLRACIAYKTLVCSTGNQKVVHDALKKKVGSTIVNELEQATI